MENSNLNGTRSANVFMKPVSTEGFCILCRIAANMEKVLHGMV